MQLLSISIALVILLHCTVDTRKCYQCSCTHDWSTNSGDCLTEQFLSGCTLKEVGDQYCFMISSYDGNFERRVFESIAPDTFEDSHFLQAIEVISQENNKWGPSLISSISYGCDWDGCNEISLIFQLPETFQITIDESILNSQLLNGQLPAQACYQCSHCINGLTGILCKDVACENGICYIDELHNYVLTPTNNCTYNFYSYCQPLSNPPKPPTVRIRATYYIDLPFEKQIRINEMDISCTKNNCNSIEVVESLKAQIRTNIEIPPGFRPLRQNQTTLETSIATTTTTNEQTTSEPSSFSTIFVRKSKRIALYYSILLYLIFIVLF